MSKFSNFRANIRNHKGRTAIGLVAVLAVGATVGGAGSLALFTSTSGSSVTSTTGRVESTVTKEIKVENTLPGVPNPVAIKLDSTKSTTAVTYSITAVSKPVVKYVGTGVVSPIGAPNASDVDFSKYTFKIVNGAGETVYGPYAANKLVVGALNGVVVPAGADATVYGVFELDKNVDKGYQDLVVSYPAVNFTATQVLPVN